MTTEQKKEITAYLSGPRDYAEGVAFYQKYGVNLRLKRQFALEDTATVRAILFDELRKLAGLSEVEFARLPRRAVVKASPLPPAPARDSDEMEDALLELADSFGVSVDELTSVDFQDRVLAMGENEDRIDELEEQLEEARSKYEEAPEPVKKMIRFREKYSFLNEPSCPDVLKVLVADMFTAYAKYKEAHARLQALGDGDSATAAADCEQVVTAYLANREIWEELDYYRENGAVLGKAAKFRELEAAEDLSKIPDVELMGQLRSAGVQESKAKKAAESARTKGEHNEKAEAAFERWSSRKIALKEEVERRKKSK